MNEASDRPDTLMELAKQKTGWHFDSSIPETSHRNIGLFRGQWNRSLRAFLDRVGEMSLWQTSSLASYQGRTRHALTEEMINWGYPATQIFHLSLDLNRAHDSGVDVPRFLSHIVSRCALESPQVEIVRFKPGHMIPWHCDMYNSYRNLNPTAIEVARYVVALDDWSWGHYVGVGNGVWHQWCSGAAVYWPNFCYHTAANSGARSMLLLLVTGGVVNSSLHNRYQSLHDVGSE